MKPILRSNRAIALVLGLSATGIAAACAIPSVRASTSDPAAPVRCEISIDEARGATTIEGRVNATRRVNGEYRLAITSRSSGGSATINQSGDFSAGPDTPALLGETTLGGSRSQYRAELEIRFDGQRLRCNERGGSQEL